MKSLLGLLVVASFGFSLGAHAEIVLACKKRNTFVHSAFAWVEIDRHDDGSHVFLYGNGLSDQMLEITFSSPITRISDTEFREVAPDYELVAQVRSGKLNFTLKNSRSTETRKGYVCETLN